MGTDSDARPIAQSLASPDRFGQIFDRHARTIHRYLARRVGAQEADGLLADVFLAAFEGRDRYDTARESALPWLYGIAANLLRKHFPREATHLAAVAALARQSALAEDPAHRVVASIDALDRLQAVSRVVDDLPDAERQALLLSPGRSSATRRSRRPSRSPWARSGRG